MRHIVNIADGTFNSTARNLGALLPSFKISIHKAYQIVSVKFSLFQ